MSERIRTWTKNYLETAKERNPAFSLRSMAKLLDVPASNLSQFLSGKRNLSPQTLQTIVHGLTASPEERKTLLEEVLKPKSLAKALATDEDSTTLTTEEFLTLGDWYYYAVRIFRRGRAIPSVLLRSPLMSRTLVLSLLLPVAHAGVIKHAVQTFKGSDELREFSLIVDVKKVAFRGDPNASYSTDAKFVLRTRSVQSLPDYALVQYIRGCQYSSRPDGSKLLNISRDYHGGTTIFKHPIWMIDTDSSDPLYTSWKNDRFGLWRWNQDPRDFTPETATYAYDARSPHPVVFATDMPGSFMRSGDEAKNSSLEFKTCLFHMRDVPAHASADGAEIDQSKAIRCFDWESKLTYDFKKKDYVIGGALEPACLGLGQL